MMEAILGLLALMVTYAAPTSRETVRAIDEKAHDLTPPGGTRA